MNTTETREAKSAHRERTEYLFQEDVTERAHSKVFVEVPGRYGPYHKEIGELSQAEMRTLEPDLRIRVVNRLLERYVDERGHPDLLVGRRPHTKDIRDIAPANLHSADLVCKGTGDA